MKKFRGWNLFLSYAESQDLAAKKAGYKFLGYAKDYSGREVKVYRMWFMRDGPPSERKRK